MLNNKKLNSKIIKFLLKYLILFFELLIFFRILNNNNSITKIKEIFRLKIKKNNLIRKYNISYFNKSEYKYNFQKIFDRRKIYKINYSYIPYMNIDKKISYKQNAEKIYELTGILNITKLDYFYYNINSTWQNLNHIHLTIGLDNKYIPLSLVAITSILKTSSEYTYIHLHIMAFNFTFNDMEKFIKLKKINKNVDFVFYTTKQAEYDFFEKSKGYHRGLGDYARLLAPQIINNTDKVLALDAGDILAQKDISEVFFYDLEDNYFAYIIELDAGKKKSRNPFTNNNFYCNAGVILINCTKFRIDELYKKAFFVAMSVTTLNFPYQDILSYIPQYKIKIMPLKYNCKLFFENDEQMRNKVNNTKYIIQWLRIQKSNPFKYSLQEIMEAALDPVIIHYYVQKVTSGIGCNKYTFQFINYSKLTGFYDEIRIKYPKPFKMCEHLI